MAFYVQRKTAKTHTPRAGGALWSAKPLTAKNAFQKGKAEKRFLLKLPAKPAGFFSALAGGSSCGVRARRVAMKRDLLVEKVNIAATVGNDHVARLPVRAQICLRVVKGGG